MDGDGRLAAGRLFHPGGEFLDIDGMEVVGGIGGGHVSLDLRLGAMAGKNGGGRQNRNQSHDFLPVKL